MSESIPFPELKQQFTDEPLSLVGKVPGVFPINKPEGMTSHDVVAKMRRKLNMRRVGHGGTLDPMAEGLLLILAGNATRLFDSLQEFRKTYIASFTLGYATDTQDRTGETVFTGDPALLPVKKERFELVLTQFRGQISQMPPMYSALKKNGVPLHKLARKGETVERDARDVTVYDLTLNSFDGTDGELQMTVSKGFYVRTLIDDIGRVLNTGAAMTKLVRTQTGPFSLEDASPITNKPKPV